MRRACYLLALSLDGGSGGWGRSWLRGLGFSGLLLLGLGGSSGGGISLELGHLLLADG